MTKQKQNNKYNGEIVNKIIRSNDRKFNFTDFYLLLARSFKSSLIRGWKFELIKAFCLFLGVLLAIMIYPNDIGLDPSCPINVLNEFNVSEITNQIHDSINGKLTNAQLNINYLIILFFHFAFVYIVSLTLVFSNEIKVSLKFNEIKGVCSKG